MSTEVQHLVAQHRYVFSRDGRSVGLTDYSVRGGAIHLEHTEVDPGLRGRGLGAAMVEQVLDRIRVESDRPIVADCPFVKGWLAQHPEYRELEDRG